MIDTRLQGKVGIITVTNNPYGIGAVTSCYDRAHTLKRRKQ
jgi:hypothetical protein